MRAEQNWSLWKSNSVQVVIIQYLKTAFSVKVYSTVYSERPRPRFVRLCSDWMPTRSRGPSKASRSTRVILGGHVITTLHANAASYPRMSCRVDDIFHISIKIIIIFMNRLSIYNLKYKHPVVFCCNLTWRANVRMWFGLICPSRAPDAAVVVLFSCRSVE